MVCVTAIFAMGGGGLNGILTYQHIRPLPSDDVAHTQYSLWVLVQYNRYNARCILQLILNLFTSTIFIEFIYFIHSFV